MMLRSIHECILLEDSHGFLTTSEMAEKWNVTRKVTALCTQGRIEGAFQKGNTWLIPSGTEKTDDPRRMRRIISESCFE